MIGEPIALLLGTRIQPPLQLLWPLSGVHLWLGFHLLLCSCLMRHPPTFVPPPIIHTLCIPLHN